MTITKADCAGWRIETDNKTYYVGEFYGQGVVYKDLAAFESGVGVCYIPEYGFDNADQNEYELFEMEAKQAVGLDLVGNPYIATEGYTRQEFDDLVEDSDISAYDLFDMLDWQSPYTLFDELTY